MNEQEALEELLELQSEVEKQLVCNDMELIIINPVLIPEVKKRKKKESAEKEKKQALEIRGLGHWKGLVKQERERKNVVNLTWEKKKKRRSEGEVLKWLKEKGESMKLMKEKELEEKKKERQRELRRLELMKCPPSFKLPK